MKVKKEHREYAFSQMVSEDPVCGAGSLEQLFQSTAREERLTPSELVTAASIGQPAVLQELS